MSPVRRRMDIPVEVLALSTFRPPDYVDLFVAPDAPEATPEEWARAAMEGAHPLGRFLAWRAACNLRLADGPDRIAGWRIAARGEDWIRMEASSWFMTAQAVFLAEPSQVSFATFIRYDRPVARAIWGAVSYGHRAAAPGFLGSAVARVRRRVPAEA